MPKKRFAVLTDCVSPEFYFPVWHNYYAQQAGPENLFVITYADMRKEFVHYQLGGIWEISDYSNASRILLIGKLTEILLSSYDYVIHVDTDEILVPDLRSFDGLSTYMTGLSRPYVTADGYDIIEHSGAEPLDLAMPIVGYQRNSCYPYDALNKTCITSIPLCWAPGFHFCSVYPEFNDLFLIHLKRADIAIQMSIGEEIAARAPAEPNRPYYLTPRENIESYNRSVRNFAAASGWEALDRDLYRAEFLRAVRYTVNYGGVYHGGPFRPRRVCIALPQVFEGVF